MTPIGSILSIAGRQSMRRPLVGVDMLALLPARLRHCMVTVKTISVTGPRNYERCSDVCVDVVLPKRGSNNLGTGAN